MIYYLLGLSLLIFGSSTLFAQDTDSEFTTQRLLQSYTEIYGGTMDVDRLSSISIKGKQVQQGVEFSFHIRKKRPNSMRYQMQKGEVVITSIFNGKKGWLQTQQGKEVSTRDLSGSELEALKKEARFDTPLYRHLQKPEYDIKLVGIEQIGSYQAYNFKVVGQGGEVSHYFLHPENFYVMQVDHMDESGELAMRTLYRDYREVEGYPFAYEVENRVGGDTVSQTRIESIQINRGILSLFFEAPKESLN